MYMYIHIYIYIHIYKIKKCECVVGGGLGHRGMMIMRNLGPGPETATDVGIAGAHGYVAYTCITKHP
jgi:hypothetical protein